MSHGTVVGLTLIANAAFWLLVVAVYHLRCIHHNSRLLGRVVQHYLITHWDGDRYPGRDVSYTEVWR